MVAAAMTASATIRMFAASRCVDAQLPKGDPLNRHSRRPARRARRFIPIAAR